MKPSFILIPGAWCPSFYYHKVVDQLTSQGYEAIALDLPSVGRKPDGTPPPTGSDDAAYVRSKATELLDQGKSVILVANSYGGFVIQEAAKGLAKEDRSSGGALVHLILLNTMLVPVGKTFLDMVGAHIPIDTSDPSIEWIDPAPAELAGMVFFGSLPADQQKYYGEMVREQSVKALQTPLTYAGYEHIRTTFVIGENDLALKPEVQHQNVDETNERLGGEKVRKVVIKADHVPMVSHPEEVVKICVEVAEAK